MAREAKQKVDERLAPTVQQAIEPGEEVRAMAPATVPPPPALAIGVPGALLAVMVVVLATLPLGVLGDLVVTFAFVGINVAFTASTTKRYALALTDRRLLWVPWNGKMATGPADAESASGVRVTATKVGRFGTKLTLRRGDGTERRVAIAPAWREEAQSIAGSLPPLTGSSGSGPEVEGPAGA